MGMANGLLYIGTLGANIFCYGLLVPLTLLKIEEVFWRFALGACIGIFWSFIMVLGIKEAKLRPAIVAAPTTAVEVLEGDTAKLNQIVEAKKLASSNNLAVPADSSETLILRKPITSDSVITRGSRSAAGSIMARSAAPSAYSRMSRVTKT